jgi:hypothetical protein
MLVEPMYQKYCQVRITVWEVQGLCYRPAIEDQDKGPSDMAQRTDGDHNPNDNSIGVLGGSRDQA